MMSSDVMASAVPARVPGPAGLSSPPDSNNASNSNVGASDSELSDLEDEDHMVMDSIEAFGDKEKEIPATDKKDIGEVKPAYYADEGRVPVFKPTMAQFAEFEAYVEKLNAYGGKSGIVKVIPPKEWLDALPSLDQAVKTIKIKEPISQEFSKQQAGAYRQSNIVQHRSYNLPQWHQTCSQSDHQPPARRGERRTNQVASVRFGRKTGSAAATKNRGSGRPSKMQKLNTEDDATQSDRLPTPDSPSVKPAETTIKMEPSSEGGSPVKIKGAKQPRTEASVSSRRKFGRREASGKIDEEAFKGFDYRQASDEYTDERCEELERNYWKTLTYAPPLYGADMLGSLFDDRTKIWNLDNLPNILDVLNEKLPGVNTAYLYLGMWKATFAWHLEDVDLYSINYLHFGAPKQWYSISQKDARKFEKAMSSIWPNDSKDCGEFLRHKTFLISPTVLFQNFGIRVNKIVHRPGEFMITFPYGYHSGFNLGYNCAEAVNFGLPSWLEAGKVAKKCDCALAQDSVWIDVAHVERRFKGEPTPEYWTEAEEDEDDDDEDDELPTDLPTPPESSGDIKPKAPRRRKNRATAEVPGEAKPKKLRIRVGGGSKEPCCLCPNDIASEPLLPTADGLKCHRLCGEYTPETSILDGVVEGTSLVSKARLELKCVYCQSRKGAKIQCSRKKCSRAYHATCAAAAGVFVERGVTREFDQAGVEYIQPDGAEYSCRFHRAKRDKKLDFEALWSDESVRKAASDLAIGQTCQLQYYKADIWAGVVVENRKSEEMLLVDVLPKGNRVEVAYQWLFMPSEADFQLPKPSANAIPMPKAESGKGALVTSQRHAGDLPRKEDVFGEGLTWAEFIAHDLLRNAAQEMVDFSKENQIMYYLGKTSTEARAQYTGDHTKPAYNPKCNFMETVPKAAPVSARHSYPASYPVSGINQNALNAARASGRPPAQHSTSNSSRPEKPYQYKPRIGNESYHIDTQSYRSQQSFLQQSAPPPYSFGSDPNPRWRSADDRTSGQYAIPAGASAPSEQPLIGALGHPSTPPGVHPSPSTSTELKANNPFSNPQASNITNKGHGVRQYGAVGSGRTSVNPFAKYPYLQVEHNKSPHDYKSPYQGTGGFMNGYEGDLKAYYLKNPDALFRNGQTEAPLAPNLLTYQNHGTQRQPYTPILPPPRSIYGPAAHPGPHAAKGTSAQHQNSLPPVNTPPSHVWEKKDSNQPHPAIRSEYNPIFHQHYQHQSQQAPPTNAPDPMPRPLREYPPILPPSYHSHQTQGSAPTPSTQASSQPYQTPPYHHQNVQPSQPYALQQATVSTPFAQAYQASQPKYGENRSPQPQTIYPHQQYFQSQQSKPHPQTHQQLRDVPDVPADSTSLVEQMMANLRRATGAQPS